MAAQSFRDAELHGWDSKAGFWDDTLGTVTAQAIGPLLDAVGTAKDVRLLDIGCGTGALAAEAARRGAEVIGMDFAPSTVAARPLPPPSAGVCRPRSLTGSAFAE